MNLALSDEQEFLREAARGILARHDTVSAAREVLDGAELPDLWPVAREAGWPGLLVAEEQGGAGLGIFEAMLVVQEAGRVLAGLSLLGHATATGLLSSAGVDGLESLSLGETRAAYLPVRPPDDLNSAWTVDPQQGSDRGEAPTAEVNGDHASVTGRLHWVPDAPGAAVLVGVALADGRPRGVLIDADSDRVTIEPVFRYDSTRSLGHVTLDSADGELLKVPDEELAAAWFVAQALLAAESVGSVETALDVSVEYAKERYTFGRPIGSYQAIKHGLAEVLRLLENARSLVLYAGWSHRGAPSEFPLAASAARWAASYALDFATREMIVVHGGIGVTWEHDAPLFFRRAQLSRRLLGGIHDASERVASELLAAAA